MTRRRSKVQRALDRAIETLEANASDCHNTHADMIDNCEDFECVRAEREGKATALEDIERILGRKL